MRVFFDPGYKHLASLVQAEDGTVVDVRLGNFADSHATLEQLSRKLVNYLKYNFSELESSVKEVYVERQLLRSPKNICIQNGLLTYWLSRTDARVKLVPPIHKFDVLECEESPVGDEVIRNAIRSERKKHMRNWKKVSIMTASRILAADETSRYEKVESMLADPKLPKMDDVCDAFLMAITTA